MMAVPNGGTWSSSNIYVATVGSTTGLLNSVIGGNATIYYTLPTGCVGSTVLTVNNLPAAISGSSSVAIGSSVTLSSSGVGEWSSSNSGVAAIGESTGVATGISGGVVTVTYTLSSTGCYRTRSLSVIGAKPINEQIAELDEETIVLSLYPNPTQGKMVFSTTVAGSLSIYNMEGKQVANYQVAAGSNSIELPKELAAGNYIARFSTGNAAPSTLRFILE
jgi:hypothetical protein